MYSRSLQRQQGGVCVLAPRIQALVGVGMWAYTWESRSKNETVDPSQPGARRCPAQGPWDRMKRYHTHSQLLLLGQKVVVLIPLVQRDQDVLEPVPHAQGEFSQLRVQAGSDV